MGKRKWEWSHVDSTKKGSTIVTVLVGLALLMSLFMIMVKSVRYTSSAKEEMTEYYTLRIMGELFLNRYLSEIRTQPVNPNYQTIEYNVGKIRYKIDSEKIIYEVYTSKQKLYRRYQVMNEK